MGTKGTIKDWRWRLTAQAGRIPCLVVIGLAGILDISTYINSAEILALDIAKCSSVAVAWAAWLPVHPGAVRRLPALALLVGAYSCTVTFAVVVAGPTTSLETSWGIAESFSIGVLLFVSAHRGTSPLTPASIVVGEVALLVQPWRLGLSPTPGALMALIGGVWLAVGFYLRHREQIDASRLALARAEQRAELARDLHDFVAHHVTGIVVLAQGMQVIAERDPRSAIRTIHQIEEAGSATMSAMRRMVAVLRTGDDEVELTTPTGVTDLASVVERFSAAGGPPVRLQITGEASGLPVVVATAACRVVMESLTNVRRHARQVTRIDVAVERTPSALLVRVTDDGTPEAGRAASDHPSGFGLQGLTERVAACGGGLRAGPRPDRGWVVEASIPA